MQLVRELCEEDWGFIDGHTPRRADLDHLLASAVDPGSTVGMDLLGEASWRGGREKTLQTALLVSASFPRRQPTEN